jgi:beta-lactam-binding protein with PASTA domain
LKTKIYQTTGKFFLVIVVSFCLASCYFSKKELITVPDLRGLSLEEAKQLARQKGLKVDVTEYGFFPSVENGFVVTQTPFPDTKVKKDRTIALQVSKGHAKVLMPKIVGMQFGKASEILTKLNLFIQEITEDSNGKDSNGKDIEGIDVGFIIKQNPIPGSEIISGSGVSVTVYKPNLPTVPNLIDVPLDDARSMIVSSGYVLGSIQFRESKSHARGVVFVQEPIPNSPAQSGSLINLIVNEKP